jgi:hypothetical protein
MIKSRIRWTGHVALMGEVKNSQKIFYGKPEGRRQLGRPRRMLEYDIKMYLTEIGWGGGDWSHLA